MWADTKNTTELKIYSRIDCNATAYVPVIRNFNLQDAGLISSASNKIRTIAVATMYTPKKTSLETCEHKEEICTQLFNSINIRMPIIKIYFHWNEKWVEFSIWPLARECSFAPNEIHLTNKRNKRKKIRNSIVFSLFCYPFFDLKIAVGTSNLKAGTGAIQKSNCFDYTLVNYEALIFI